MEWKERYKRDTRPAYDELITFLSKDVRPLFETFTQTMQREYRVYNKYQRYENTAGWVYGFCRNYRCELLSVKISEDYFSVLGVKVNDEASLNQALEKAKIAYENGYEARYAQVSEAKRVRQIQGTKRRLAREEEERAKITENVDTAMLNRFVWSKKVSRNKLQKLYQSDAQGLLDQELLDDVGFAFYARCKQAKETRELLDKGLMICHHCGAVLAAQAYASVTACECGYCYSYREYRRSANANSMPGGRAKPIFDEFVEKWPLCKDAKAKMMLIDWMIHECHVSVMSNLAGRSVCVNLIEGTAKQLRDMLEMLAGHI